jgi:peptidyl-prolyl cis-trans isomerase SurA
MISNLIKIFFLFAIINNNSLLIASSNKIIVKIDESIITSYELKNKIKTVLILADQELNQNNINNTKNQALAYLINMKIKEKEILKYRPNLDDINTDNQLKSISANNIENFKKKFIQNNLDLEIYLKDLKIEVAWQKLIYDTYSPKIIIDKKIIKKDLQKLIETKKKITEYKLAEIEISKNQQTNFDDEIKFIENQIKDNGFGITASKYSISTSAKKKGDLGWINEKSLNSKTYELINKLKIGETTKAIRNTNGAVFLKLINTRQSTTDLIDIDKLENEIILQKKNELLNLYSVSYLSKLKNNTLITYK